jgi:cell division GTPase FtsZ
MPVTEAIGRLGIPVIILCALPMANEGSLAKSNAIKTLDKLAQAAVNNSQLIQTLIVVDNSRIEEIYPQVSASKFWEVANFDIANTLHIFNTLTACDSKFASLDPTDFVKILTAGNCTIYGKIEIPIKIENNELIMDEGELARAVTKNVEKGLLAEGFNVAETTRAGAIITANERILGLVPAMNINYAMDALTEALGGASLFTGIYEEDSDKDVLTVYTVLSGIGLPRDRVDRLLKEADADLQLIEDKQADKSKMQVFVQDRTVEREKSGYQKMKDRNTSFGRLIANRQKRSRG